jgi:hypothetical protein
MGKTVKEFDIGKSAQPIHMLFRVSPGAAHFLVGFSRIRFDLVG